MPLFGPDIYVYHMNIWFKNRNLLPLLVHVPPCSSMFLHMFQEVMASRCLKRIREKISEQEMWVEGEFASGTDMKDELKFSEWLSSKLIYFLCNVGFILHTTFKKRFQGLKTCIQ